MYEENDYGIRVDTLLATDPIKPYHIKESILSFKEAAKKKKEIDKRTKMSGPYKLSALNIRLFS